MHPINAEKVLKKLPPDPERPCTPLGTLAEQSFNKTPMTTMQLCKLSENVLNRQFHSTPTTQRHTQMAFHAAEHALMENALLKQRIEALKDANRTKQSRQQQDSILHVNRVATSDQIDQAIAEWARNHEKTVTKVSKQTQKKPH